METDMKNISTNCQEGRKLSAIITNVGDMKVKTMKCVSNQLNIHEKPLKHSFPQYM